METSSHAWYTPEDIAERLHAQKSQGGWRACCPAHNGDNPNALTIKEGKDKRGNPCTLLYCHAHQCPIDAICEALGIGLVNLFAIHPTYAQATRGMPRSHDQRIERMRFQAALHSQDDLAQIMLESEIVNDAGFLARVPNARQTFWRLAQEPARKAGLVKALIEAALPVRVTLDALQREWGPHEPGHLT